MAESSAVLTTLPQLDALRDDPNTTWSREAGSNLDLLSTGPDIAICHIYNLHPFTYGDYVAVQFQYDDAAAMALAIEHLNTGNGRLVPEVEGLSDRCKIRFTIEYADTQYTPSVAVNHVVNVTSRIPGLERLPCAFVGAYRSAESIPTSMLTGMWNYPQISGASTSADLDDKNQYPLFGRTIPSDHGNAVPIIQFMYEALGIKHLAVLNVNDAYGNSFVEGLRMAAEKYAPDLKIHQAPVDDGMAAIRTALSSIKETQYRYIFAIVFTQEVHDDVLSEAYAMGLAGTGKHQWLFADSFASIEGRTMEANSVLNLAYRGVGMIEATGGIPGIGLTGYENFLEAMAEVSNTDDLEYLFSKYPKYDDKPVYDESIKAFTNYLKPASSVQATFLYEATIALGLSACAAVDENFLLDGKKQYETMVSTVFGGINGKVVFDPTTGNKDPLYTLYKVTNYVDEPDSENGMVRFKELFTHIYQEGEWNELTPFVFNSGSTEIPSDIPPPEVNDNTINTGVRISVLILCGLVLILGMGLMAWTHRNRKARVVLASQPFFLHIICVGAIVMVCTIIPMSIDHGVASLQGCTKACTSIPWLGAMGFSMTVSALFTKTHRINIILNNANRMQRIRVTILDVAKPMIFLLSVNTVVLSVMTALAPPHYDMIVESVDAFDRPNEIRGQCNFSDSYAYVGSVCSVNLAALFFTIVQAVKARNLSMEFAESAQIFRALVAIIMVMFVGGPVLLLSRDNANTFLFVASAIIFVASASILLLLFVPKIHFWMTASQQKSKRRLFISGIDMSRPNTPSQYSVPNDSNFDEENPDEMDEDLDTEEFTGMKILTTKTPEELVREVEALKRLLRKAKSLTPSMSKEGAIPDIPSIPIATRLETRNSAASQEAKNSTASLDAKSSTASLDTKNSAAPLDAKNSATSLKSILKKPSDLSQGVSDDSVSVSLGKRSDNTIGKMDDYLPLSPQRSVRDDDSITSASRERLESLREKREVAKLKFAALASIEHRLDPVESSVQEDVCANGSMTTAATSTSSSVPMVPVQARE